jgi:selenocysteine-specific elongation factor
MIASPDHRVEIEASDGPAARLLEVLSDQPFAPPSLAEAMQRAGAGVEVVRALAQRGDLVRVSEDIAFTQDAYAKAVGFVKELIATTGSVSVGQLRDRMGASRRPVLALLEHLDAEKVTRRVGDARVLFR